MAKKEIHQVFTPRRSDVNMEMYASRPKHERSLLRALRRNTHVLIYGDSGNGKSWLYRKILAEYSFDYVAANCANASRLGSISREICTAIIEPGTLSREKISEEKSASVNAYVAKGEIKSTSNYNVSQSEPLLEAFESYNNAVKGNKIIVLDNLEAIFGSKELMAELANILILLDDPKYGKFNIKILLVGTPGGVIEYFRKTMNVESVSNRIKETRKVGELSKSQSRFIIESGFGQLSIALEATELEYVSAHITHITLGVAQRVHEYCEALAYAIEDNDCVFTREVLFQADTEWLVEGLRQSYGVVEGCMNSRETAVARRNQVIFCIGKLSSHQFDSARIDKKIRAEFSNTVPNTHTGVGSILSELSKDEAGLLYRNSKTNTYSIRDPRYLMCIRTALYKDPIDEKVKRRKFKYS